jgi:hypothetical protein
MINGEAPLLRRDTGNLAGLMHFKSKGSQFPDLAAARTTRPRSERFGKLTIHNR